MEWGAISKSDAVLLRQDSCETQDYLCSIACGAIAGLLDIFFVGAPGESALGQWTDKQVDTAVMKFARLETGCWKGKQCCQCNRLLRAKI